eukprot:scaffold2779_cov25-Prasinocladus_malaysianus.AAC.1
MASTGQSTAHIACRVLAGHSPLTFIASAAPPDAFRLVMRLWFRSVHSPAAAATIAASDRAIAENMDVPRQ